MMTLDEILETGKDEKPNLMDELACITVDAISGDDREHAIFSYRLLHGEESVIDNCGRPLPDCPSIHIDGNVWVPPPRMRGNPLVRFFREPMG